MIWQTKPGWVCTWVTAATAWSALRALLGSPGAHCVEVPLLDWMTTVTPLVPEHDAACAGALAPTRPAVARTAPTRVPRTRRARVTGERPDDAPRGSLLPPRG